MRGAPGAMGPEAGHWMKCQGLLRIQKTQLREKTEINNPPGGGEFGLSSFLFSQPGPVPKPLNLVKILALHPRKEPPGGPQRAKS